MVKATELGTESIRRLLIKYALPGIIAMTASSLYNLVDSVFIGHVGGALALGGLTVAKPFMDICAAFGSFVGVGAGTLLAIKLGQIPLVQSVREAGDAGQPIAMQVGHPAQKIFDEIAKKL